MLSRKTVRRITRLLSGPGHYSFLLRRNKVVSLGKNNRTKTHPVAFAAGYFFHTIHSELDAVLRVVRTDRLKLVNLRVTKLGALGMAKPCKHCQRFLRNLGLKEVWFSNDKQLLEKLP